MRRSGSFVAAAIAAFSAVCLSPVEVRAGSISLRADQWCPYNCTPDAERPGYVVEIARQAFAPAQIQVDYALLNWARSIEDARAGHFDGIIGALQADAPDFVFPSEPVGMTTDGFAVRKGTAFHVDGPKSFDGKVIGAIISYAYTSEVQSYIESNKDDRSKVQLTSGEDALAQNLKKLAAGRLDIVVDDANVLARAIKLAGLEDRLTIADHGTPVPIYIAFSPASPKARDYAALLTAGILRMRASGQLADILARYDVADWH